MVWKRSCVNLVDVDRKWVGKRTKHECRGGCGYLHEDKRAMDWSVTLVCPRCGGGYEWNDLSRRLERLTPRDHARQLLVEHRWQILKRFTDERSCAVKVPMEWVLGCSGRDNKGSELQWFLDYFRMLANEYLGWKVKKVEMMSIPYDFGDMEDVVFEPVKVAGNWARWETQAPKLFSLVTEYFGMNKERWAELFACAVLSHPRVTINTTGPVNLRKWHKREYWVVVGFWPYDWEVRMVGSMLKWGVCANRTGELVADWMGLPNRRPVVYNAVTKTYRIAIGPDELGPWLDRWVRWRQKWVTKKAKRKLAAMKSGGRYGSTDTQVTS